MSNEKKLIDGNELKTPYENLVPKMRNREFDGFEASILEEGQKEAIEIDEENSVLDGHHRLKVLIKHGKPVLCRVVTGLESDLEKKAYVISKALNRRNLTAKSTEELREKQKKLYGELREKNPKEWTLDRIAKLCGVDRSLVGKWFRNGTDPITKPDARRKVTPEIAEQIEAELLTSSGNKVAKKYGLGKATVSRIRNKGKKQTTAKPAIKDPGATGPFVEHWPTEKNQERGFLNRVKKACSAGQMAVAVVPNGLVEKVRDLIEPQKEQRPDKNQETLERVLDPEGEQLDGVEDEADGRTDEDRKAIAALFGDADDEEDDA